MHLFFTPFCTDVLPLIYYFKVEWGLVIFTRPSEESAREGILSISEMADIIKKFNGRVEGLKVDAVDITGAGDAFVGGILAQLAEDDTWLKDEKLTK